MADGNFEFEGQECPECGEKKMIVTKVNNVIDVEATQLRLSEPLKPQSWQFKGGKKYRHCQTCKHIWKVAKL